MAFVATIQEVMRLPDLRRRILITLLILAVYRLAANIPVPGVDHQALEAIFNPATPNALGNFAGVLDLLSGGAVSNFSVLAMGVYPYITASIIIQILTPVIPALEDLQRQGQAGRDQVTRYTYYASIPLAIFQSVAQINIFRDPTSRVITIIPNFGLNPARGDDLLLTFTVIAVMTAGTMFAIWLGELITQDGIGNGISLIIFAGIVSQIPFQLPQLFTGSPGITARNLILFLTITVVSVAVIVLVQGGQRRIPVKYGKRIRGMKMYGGGSTYLPLPVNHAGMIPLIFASSILTFPAVAAGFFLGSPIPWVLGTAQGINILFGQQGGTAIGGQIAYWIIYFVLVVAFTYLYTDIMIRNQRIADNLQRSGGFIPGIRPGPRTEEFIQRVVNRVTFVGAMFLGLIATLPGIVTIVLNLIRPGAGTEIQAALIVISGGGLIIVVGVITDTMRQLEAQLLMRNRESFIR